MFRHGDSEGPAYIQQRDVLYAIGVSSGQDFQHTDSQVERYGIFECYKRVLHFANWIRGVIGN
jgi:hypothetical protein